MTEMMVEKQERAGGLVEPADLANLGRLAKRLAEGLNPGRRSYARKALPETKASFAQRGETGPEREGDNRHIPDRCVGLFEAAGHRQAWNPAAAGRTAELFLFHGSNDRSFVGQDGRRVAPEGPNAERKHRQSLPPVAKACEARRARIRPQEPGPCGRSVPYR